MEPRGEMDPRQRTYVEDPEKAGRSLDDVTLLNWRHLLEKEGHGTLWECPYLGLEPEPPRYDNGKAT